MGRFQHCSWSAIFNAFRNYLVKTENGGSRPAKALAAAMVWLALLGAAPAPRPPFIPGFAAAAHTTLLGAKKSRIDFWGLRRTERGGGSLTLAMVTTPRRAARVRFIEVGRRAMARPLYESVDCPGALAMINGSFFEGDRRTEHIQGLLRLNGRTLRGPSARTSGGFLATDGRTLKVFDRDQAAFAESQANAIESSPILIRRGLSGMRRDDRVRADRVAAGVTTDGDVVLFAAFGQGGRGVSLYEFEELIRAGAAVQGKILADVIALDGGPSAHLWLPRQEVFLGQTGSIFLTDAVCVGVG